LELATVEAGGEEVLASAEREQIVTCNDSIDAGVVHDRMIPE
jgi:hypothetical protein